MVRGGKYICYRGIVYIIADFEVLSEEQVNLKYRINESQSDTVKYKASFLSLYLQNNLDQPVWAKYRIYADVHQVMAPCQAYDILMKYCHD